MQPGREPGISAECSNLAKQLKEHLLRHILGVSWVPEHSQTNAVYMLAVRPVQVFESLCVAVLGTLNGFLCSQTELCWFRDGPCRAHLTFGVGQIHNYAPFSFVRSCTCVRLELAELWQKFVAGTVNCYEVLGLRRFSFEFLTQPQNMVVDRAGARIVFVTPHFIEQFVARNHSSWILNKVFQSLKLHCRHRNRLSSMERGHLGKIYPHIAEAILALWVELLPEAVRESQVLCFHGVFRGLGRDDLGREGLISNQALRYQDDDWQKLRGSSNFPQACYGREIEGKCLQKFWLSRRLAGLRNRTI